MGENRFLYRGIKYNIFGLIPKTSYVTQTLNIKYRDIIEHHDKLYKDRQYNGLKKIMTRTQCSTKYHTKTEERVT